MSRAAAGRIDTGRRAVPGGAGRRLPAPLACLLVLGGLLLSVTVHPYGVPPMDDTYIHLTYARNLLQGRFMEFNAGCPSSGTTSPLWTVLAVLPAAAGDSAPVLAMVLSSLVAVSALLAASRRAWALPLMLTGPFLFHASSGMETSLAALVVVVFCLRIGAAAAGRRGLSFLLAVAVLTRPELSVLAVPAVMWLRRRRKGFRATALFLLPAAAAAVLWLAWNLYSTGLPLPASFYAKVLAGGPAFDPVGLAKGLLLASPGLLLLLPFPSVRSRSTSRPEVSLVAPLLFLSALLTQPNGFFQMRYYVPFLVAAAVSVPSRWTRRTGVPPLPLLAVLLALPGVAVLASRRSDASIDVDCIDRNPAILVDRIADDDAVIAAADAGAAGWFTTGPGSPGRLLLDLDALVTPELVSRRGSDRWNLVRGVADFIIAFPVQYRGLLAPTGVGRLEPVAEYRSPRSVICGEDRVGVYRVVTE